MAVPNNSANRQLNMATASLRERTRSARTFSRNRSENEEDNVHLDPNKDATENAYEILSNICKKQGLSDIRRVTYLNLFIKLMDDVRNGQLPMLISKKDTICCLRVGLVNNNAAVRAATLRVLRHCISEPSDVIIINKLQIPHLIARSIDIVLKNDYERIQALRLALKMLNLAPKQFPLALTRCLVALANSVNETKDRMIYPALCLLCQLCVLNPEMAIECSGESCLLRCCIETAQGRINECLVGCLLFLLNKPETRNKAHLQLDVLTSVYCDLQRKKGLEAQTFASSRLSILAALRAWTGVFHLGNPNNASGMKAVINVLYLNDIELRRAIVELLYEVLGLDVNDWAKDVDTVLDSVDPYHPRDSWRPTEGFMVAEGKDILPHRSDTRPNLTEVHTALLIYTFLECGLLSALVEVAVDSDPFLSTQAVVLIGYLLDLAHKLLPAELLDLSPSLPSLVNHMADGEPTKHMRAIMAMSVLHRVHCTLSRNPVPSSLFLRHHMMQGCWHKKKVVDGNTSGKAGPGVYSGSGTKSERKTLKYLDLHIKDSEIFSQRDPRDWVWTEISTILKCRNEAFLRLDDVQHKVVLRKLIHFYKPSSSQYSVMDYTLRDPRYLVHSSTALDLIDLLIDSPQESECEKLLDELLTDICREIGYLAGTGSAHDCFLSPSKVSTSLSQHYFLMIGHLTCTLKGLAALERARALQLLQNVVDNTPHDVYIKLIISSLCYTHSSMARKILGRALTSSIDGVRVYATELLLVLARTGAPMFNKWGLELLIPQIYDESKLVTNACIDILHELSYDPVFLECLVDTRPPLLHLGDKGHLLLIRFLSTPAGFAFLKDSHFVENELEKWENGYNYRYVGLVEGAVHDAVTLHQREDSGRYSRRLTNARHRWKPVWVPPHLYGQLASHAPGFAALEANPCVQRMVQKVLTGNCDTDADILDLKAGLWSLANMATSALGLRFLEERQLLQAFVNTAHNCPVLSLRATAFYCLSLVASMEDGATLLAQMDWFAVRRSRSARWPVEMEERTRDPDDVISALAFSLDDADSVEELSSFLELPLTLPLALTPNQRASTLPPGLSGDLNETDYMTSPSSCNKSRHQRSYSETGYLLPKTTSEEPSTPQRMSFQDAAGLAKLQALQATHRPDLSSNQLFPELQPSKRYLEHRSSSPMTEFEAENPPRLYSNSSRGSPDSAADETGPGGPQCEGSSGLAGPVYRGICMPRALVQFLTIVERKEEKRRKRGSLSFSEMEQVKEAAEEKTGSSSSSDWSDVEGPIELKRGGRRSHHDTAHCVACCTRVPRPKRQRRVSSSSFRLRTDTESSYGNAAEGSPISLKWRLKAASEGGSGESFSCGEGEGDLPSNLASPAPAPLPVLSHTRVRRDILKHVGRMCNPVWAKASRTFLLQLKQSHQSVFQDVCLYSSACAILSNSVCRVSARRVIQELFLELAFGQFYEDAETTLAPYAPTAPQPPPLGGQPPSSSHQTPDEAPSVKNCVLSSPTKNLSTVFENLPACGAQSLRSTASLTIKEDTTKT